MRLMPSTTRRCKAKALLQSANGAEAWSSGPVGSSRTPSPCANETGDDDLKEEMPLCGFLPKLEGGKPKVAHHSHPLKQPCGRLLGQTVVGTN